MFSLFATVSANTPDPEGGGPVDMNVPEVLEALARRYVAGEELTPEEREGAIRYATVTSVEEEISVVAIAGLTGWTKETPLPTAACLARARR